MNVIVLLTSWLLLIINEYSFYYIAWVVDSIKKRPPNTQDTKYQGIFMAVAFWNIFLFDVTQHNNRRYICSSINIFRFHYVTHKSSVYLNIYVVLITCLLYASSSHLILNNFVYHHFVKISPQHLKSNLNHLVIHQT